MEVAIQTENNLCEGSLFNVVLRYEIMELLVFPQYYLYV